MADRVKIARVVGALIGMTDGDLIKWDGDDITGHQCKYKDFLVRVWWFQDGNPTLFINDVRLEGRDYFISDLLWSIDRQYRRLQKGPYSKELLAQGKLQSERQEELDRKNAQALDENIDNFLKEFDASR